MIRFERIDRRSFFDGMTPGWMLGVIGYVGAILTLYFLPNDTGGDITPCLLKQSTGWSCPLCGGTTASISLITGHPLSALAANPAVAIGLPLIGLWAILYVGFGIAVRLAIPKPLLVALVIAAIAANWAYLIHSRSSQIDFGFHSGETRDNFVLIVPAPITHHAPAIDSRLLHVTRAT